jgi:hypothetical protein
MGVGPYSGLLAVNDNAPAGLQTAKLTGTGLPQATPPGNYTIQVTASYSASLPPSDTHVINVPVNVQ